MLTGSASYATYSLERAQAEAVQKLARQQRIIFGEFRPADRNCAVRVEIAHNDTYQLHADVRNDFEDKLELEGGKKLRRTFIKTVESLEL